MRKIKNVKLFFKFSRYKIEETQEGLEQFFKAQSFGTMPRESDPYYICLNDGKEQFDLLCSELQQMYKKGEWWGWYQLWVDWEGERWVIPYICKWHKNIPEWVSEEGDSYGRKS